MALLFTLWPLGRAEKIRAGVLFRDEVAPERVWPAPYVIGLTLAAAALLVTFAVLSAEVPLLALSYCGAVAGVFAIFAGLGNLVAWLCAEGCRGRGSRNWRSRSAISGRRAG